MTYLAAFADFDGAGSTGVKFYRYTDGFLHEKVMLIDEDVATVGTANFDNRSFRLNFEITGVVADAAFAAQGNSKPTGVSALPERRGRSGVPTSLRFGDSYLLTATGRLNRSFE